MECPELIGSIMLGMVIMLMLVLGFGCPSPYDDSKGRQG